MFKQVAFALVLTLIIGGCFAATLYQQKNIKVSLIEGPHNTFQVHTNGYNFNPLIVDNSFFITVPASFNLQTTDISSQPLSANLTRTQIYDFINQNPGVQFRAVCAGLCIPVGLAQYHLGVLVKSGLVSFVRDGKYKRFFVSKKFSKKQIMAISLLRHKTAKRIVEVLLNKKQLSHGKLAIEVRITSQALTWQMKNLKNTDFVLQFNDGLKTIYTIDESSENLLKTYLTIIN
jgi:predicted transcriptional regulator